MKNETVAVTVICYNSSNTILETLDSILAQTYGSKNIELVISDDASCDNTAAVVDSWLSKNASAFNSTSFIVAGVNGGISKNVNTAWKASRSPWIKTIAADDILLPDCLGLNLKYIDRHPECRAVFSSMIHFKEAAGQYIDVKITPNVFNKYFYSLDADQQLNFLLKYSFNMAPTSFISREALLSVGYAEENFTLIEDLPLWIKLTKNKIKLHYFESPTIKYRISDSITNSRQKLINHNFVTQLNQLYSDLLYPNAGWLGRLFVMDRTFDNRVRINIANLTNNKKSLLARFLLVSVCFVRPLWWVAKLSKIYNWIKFTLKQRMTVSQACSEMARSRYFT